jgi:hypothetical protein
MECRIKGGQEHRGAVSPLAHQSGGLSLFVTSATNSLKNLSFSFQSGPNRWSKAAYPFEKLSRPAFLPQDDILKV